MSQFILVSRNKHTGSIYFISQRVINSYDEALEIAKRKARVCSEDYKYIVLKVEAVCEVQPLERPITVSHTM